MVKNVYLSLHAKCPFVLSEFSDICIFSIDFRNTNLSNFTQIRLGGTELVHADGRTDMTKLIVAFGERPYKLITEELIVLCHRFV